MAFSPSMWIWKCSRALKGSGSWVSILLVDTTREREGECSTIFASNDMNVNKKAKGSQSAIHALSRGNAMNPSSK